MKIRFTTVALLAVLSLAATGCQKEQDSFNNTPVQETFTIRHIVYTIDGSSYATEVRTEQEWMSFLKGMMAIAKKGHIVSFRDSSFTSDASSKVVYTYTTTSEDDAVKWCDKMTKEGYDVVLEYNPRTGEFTCTAVK